MKSVFNLDFGGHCVPPYTAGNDVKIVDGLFLRRAVIIVTRVYVYVMGAVYIAYRLFLRHV